MSSATVSAVIVSGAQGARIEAAVRSVCRDPLVSDVLVIDVDPADRRARQALARLDASGRRVTGTDRPSPPSVVNEAVRSTTGALILVLDAGDTLDNHWLATAWARLGARPDVAFVASSAHGQSDVSDLSLTGARLDDSLRLAPRVLFRRELWNELGGFDKALARTHWIDFWWRAFESGVRGETMSKTGTFGAAAPEYWSFDPGAATPQDLQRFYHKHHAALSARHELLLVSKERLLLAERARHDTLVRRRLALEQDAAQLASEIGIQVGALVQQGGSRIDFGDLRRTSPFSPIWGLDRGIPLDRHYIHAFLERHRGDVRGRVLEIKDDGYTRRFGDDRVTTADVLDIDRRNPCATVFADLSRADAVPADTYDCFILTQTLGVIFDAASALQHAYRILKPGGVLLCTMPATGRISYEEGLDGDYWRFTEASVRRLFAGAFPLSAFELTGYGNVLTSAAFLYGLAPDELSPSELDVTDPYFPVVYTVRAVKPENDDARRSSDRVFIHSDAVRTKDPSEVLHHAADIEAYLDSALAEQGLDFDRWVMKFGEGMYRLRNDVILEWLQLLQPRRILELACAGWFLAQRSLESIPSIEAYICSNFSSRMLDVCASHLSGYSNCELRLLDADALDEKELTRYDTCITTSFEHIEHDLELIRKLPPRCRFVFSVAGFDDPEHFRVFENERQIRRRYADLLQILDVRAIADASKWAVVSQRRD